MISSIKTPQEIEIMTQGGSLLARIMEELQSQIKVGIATQDLDELAEKLIFQCGGQPSFKLPVSKGGGGFCATMCISINEEIVHGVPSDRKIKDGDLVTLDIGMVYKGFHTDMAVTVGVGKVDLEIQRMIRVAKKSLKRAIKKARPGNTIGDIGNTIERYVEDQGFNVIRDLCGHSIGHSLHEDPQIMNFGKRHKGPVIKPGMTFCVEPMITAGNPEIICIPNSLTYRTKDGRWAAHCEHTLAVFPDGCHILTATKDDLSDQEDEKEE